MSEIIEYKKIGQEEIIAKAFLKASPEAQARIKEILENGNDPGSRKPRSELDKNGIAINWKNQNGHGFVILETPIETKLKRFRDSLISANMDKYLECDINDIKLSRKDEFKNGLLNQEQSLFFYGPPGTSKTFTACALGKSAIIAGKQVKFVRWYDLILELKNSWGKQDISEQKTLDKYNYPRILVIDELGAENKVKASDWEIETLLSIISSRNSSGKQFIVTTNMSIETIMNVYTKALVSRLMHRERVIAHNFEKEKLYR